MSLNDERQQDERFDANNLCVNWKFLFSKKLMPKIYQLNQ